MTPRDILFLSHGAPSLLTGRSQARAFLEGFGPHLTGARALGVVSAHWESDPIRITASDRPETIHDFRGFGAELERFIWPVSGAPELAAEIAGALADEGIRAELDTGRGLDHGVWVPLALALPAPDAPVVQISLPARTAPDTATVDLGAALGRIAAHLDVQLVFSGAATHSLRDALPAPEEAPVTAFAESFNTWVAEQISAGALTELMQWRSAPEALRNHPTPEHLRPLLAAMAAAGGAAGRRLHASWTHAALAMDIWAFPASTAPARML